MRFPYSCLTLLVLKIAAAVNIISNGDIWFNGIYLTKGQHNITTTMIKNEPGYEYRIESTSLEGNDTKTIVRNINEGDYIRFINNMINMLKVTIKQFKNLNLKTIDLKNFQYGDKIYYYDKWTTMENGECIKKLVDTLQLHVKLVMYNKDQVMADMFNSIEKDDEIE